MEKTRKLNLPDSAAAMADARSSFFLKNSPQWWSRTFLEAMLLDDQVKQDKLLSLASGPGNRIPWGERVFMDDMMTPNALALRAEEASWRASKWSDNNASEVARMKEAEEEGWAERAKTFVWHLLVMATPEQLTRVFDANHSTNSVLEDSIFRGLRGCVKDAHDLSFLDVAIQAGRYDNVTMLGERFEISPKKMLLRAISCMDAPLARTLYAHLEDAAQSSPPLRKKKLVEGLLGSWFGGLSSASERAFLASRDDIAPRLMNTMGFILACARSLEFPIGVQTKLVKGLDSDISYFSYDDRRSWSQSIGPPVMVLMDELGWLPNNQEKFRSLSLEGVSPETQAELKKLARPLREERLMAAAGTPAASRPRQKA